MSLCKSSARAPPLAWSERIRLAVSCLFVHCVFIACVFIACSLPCSFALLAALFTALFIAVSLPCSPPQQSCCPLPSGCRIRVLCNTVLCNTVSFTTKPALAVQYPMLCSYACMSSRLVVLPSARLMTKSQPVTWRACVAICHPTEHRGRHAHAARLSVSVHYVQ